METSEFERLRGEYDVAKDWTVYGAVGGRQDRSYLLTGFATITNANGNLTGGDALCLSTSPPQNYMWSGMIGLFLKMEQVPLFNELNFNLPTTFPDNATSIRRTIA